MYAPRPDPPPFAHQLEALRRSADARAFALLMEMGTGKSRVALDTAGALFGAGKIKTLLVVAPNGVHKNWLVNEAPAYLNLPHDDLLWRSGAAGTRAFKRLALERLASPKLLAAALNVEAAITPAATELLRALFRRGPVLTVLDESSVAKNPSAKRTKLLWKVGRASAYRRILTGTPVTEGPLDLYAQFYFLDPAILGFTSFFTFKHRYAAWEKGYNGATGVEFEQQKRDEDGRAVYLHLDELQAKIAPHSFRVLKAECLDLPPKLYETRYFPLSAREREAYERLRDEYAVELGGGLELTVAHVLTRLLRLQQVASGYLPTGRGLAECPACRGAGCEECDGAGWAPVEGPVLDLGGETPSRLAALLAAVEQLQGQFIVWARFTHDVQWVAEALRRAGVSAVRYDGQTKPEDRTRAIADFQAGRARAFVGNPQAGGRGLTLTAASTVIYYSNSFSSEQRLQSEDRAHRIGLKHAVTYVDLVAEDTVDEDIVRALKEKKSLMDLVMRDAATLANLINRRSAA